jgi:glycosyltransferase involved in cell wall biosynthesis
MLEKVFTTTPVDRFRSRADIDRTRIDWVPYPELFGSRLPYVLRVPANWYSGSQYLYCSWFDRLVSASLARMAPDIFVAFAQFGLHGVHLCRQRGIPSIIERGSAHTIVRSRILEEEYSRLGLAKLHRKPDSRILERELEEYETADYVSVPSEFAAGSFIEMGVPASKLIKVPYGVDTSRFAPGPEPSRRPFRVLSVGNLGVEKGTGYLLEGIETLGRQDVELLLVGTLDGYLATRFNSFGYPKVFGGHVAQHELPGWYHSASVYCLLSVQEGLSMTVLEAMSCGRPVIATVNTGAADIIDDGVDGFVVPIRDSQAVADRLSRLYCDPDFAAAMGMRARLKAETFTWDHYGSRLADAYSRIERVRQ